MGWLACKAFEQPDEEQGGCWAYVLPSGDDEDGWPWLEGKRGERREARRNYNGGDWHEALKERWINPGEDDDIAASKFLCGGQVVAALTTKEG